MGILDIKVQGNKKAVSPFPLSELPVASSHTPLQGMDGGATPLFPYGIEVSRHKNSPCKQTLWGLSLPREFQTGAKIRKLRNQSQGACKISPLESTLLLDNKPSITVVREVVIFTVTST
jgi:hypothetical protein